MFNEFSSIICRQSDCIQYIKVNALTGCVDVMFNNGTRYSYVNVSRRAIVNLMINPNMSLGFWFNANIAKNMDRVECINSFYVPSFAV